MRIAVTSNHGTHITGHAGRCRHFLVFEVIEDEVVPRPPVQLGAEDTFHAHGIGSEGLLASIDVLITGGMGPGLARRCTAAGVEPVVTELTDPAEAVRRWLAGELVGEQPESHGGCSHCSH